MSNGVTKICGICLGKQRAVDTFLATSQMQVRFPRDVTDSLFRSTQGPRQEFVVVNVPQTNFGPFAPRASIEAHVDVIFFAAWAPQRLGNGRSQPKHGCARVLQTGGDTECDTQTDNASSVGHGLVADNNFLFIFFI